MHTTRLVNAGLAVALVSGAVVGPAAAVPALDHGLGNGAVAAPSAAHVSGTTHPIPQPPTWPLHPEPITQVATMADGRPIPQPPTWPLHPKVIPPPRTSRPRHSSWTTPPRRSTGAPRPSVPPPRSPCSRSPSRPPS